MKNSAFDFTQGSIAANMIFFSWPIFLSNLLQASYQFIDSLWVGNLLGSDALGTITVSSTIIFTTLSFIIGINGATLTVLSQQKGKKDSEGLKNSLNAFVFILGILTLAFGVLGFWGSAFLLRLLGTPEGILPMATAYLRINFCGILFLFGYNFIGTVLRAVGDSKTPMRFVMLAVLCNAVLDPILISWFHMDVYGAAVATVVSQGIAFLYGIIHSVKKSKLPFTMPRIPERKYARAVIKLGLPGGLQMVAVSSGITMIMGIVTSFGTDVVAGFGAAQRLDSMIMLPALTLGSTVNSMAGQNIGVRRWDRVGAIAKHAVALIFLLTLAISLAVFWFAETFVSLFVDDPATISFGAEYLRIVAFFYPFLGINFVLNGIMRAAGAMFGVLALNLISFWILRFPLTLMFSRWLGPDGIGWGIGASFILSSLFAASYYFRGRWRSIRLFDEGKD